MKRLPTLLLVLAAALPARAEVFNTGRTLRPGAFSIAGEFQQGLAPRSESGNLYLGVGLVHRLDLGVRLSMPFSGPVPSSYFGADLEFGLVADTGDTMALSLSLGAHALDGAKFAADVTLVASKLVAAHLEPFFALDADLGLKGELGRQVRAVVGVDVPLVHHLELVAEAGLGLTASTPTYGSLGFNLYY